MKNIVEKIGAFSPIAKSILFSKKLKATEIRLFQIISEFADNEKGYTYATRETLAGLMNMSARNLDRILHKLIREGFIKKEYGLSSHKRRAIHLSCIPQAENQNEPDEEKLPTVDEIVNSHSTETSDIPRQERQGIVDKNVHIPRLMDQEQEDQDGVCEYLNQNKNQKNKKTDKVQESCTRTLQENNNALTKTEPDAPSQTRPCEHLANNHAPEKEIDPPLLSFDAWFNLAVKSWNAAFPAKTYRGNSLTLIYTTRADLAKVYLRFPDCEAIAQTITRYKTFCEKPHTRYNYATLISFLEFGLDIFTQENIPEPTVNSVKKSAPAKESASDYFERLRRKFSVTKETA